MTDSKAQPLWPQHFDNHYGHLANTLPRWLIDASPSRRAALSATAPQIRQAFKNTSPAQHQILKRLNASYWTAQNSVDQRLQQLQDPRAFGEPLLRDALAEVALEKRRISRAQPVHDMASFIPETNMDPDFSL